MEIIFRVSGSELAINKENVPYVVKRIKEEFGKPLKKYNFEGSVQTFDASGFYDAYDLIFKEKTE